MPNVSLIATTVSMTDILIPLTLLSVWLALRRAAGPTAPLPTVFIPALGLALVSGLLWSFWPTLSHDRFLPPPSGQAGAIFSVIIGFAALRLLPSVRAFFREAKLEWLVTMGIWRVIFGASLLVIGLSGGLPSAFFWSAAFGDILVGLWGISMLARRLKVAQTEVIAWNMIGLADLGHVLLLGALFLPAFYLANLAVPPVNLLPLTGVPVFFALHVLTLSGFLSRRKTTTAVAKSTLLESAL
jgi:hypothetical protein